MLPSVRYLLRPRPLPIRQYATQLAKGKEREDAHERALLKAVQARLAERKELLDQLANADDGSEGLSIKAQKEIKDTEPLRHAWDEWTRINEGLEEMTSLINDPDPTMQKMARDEQAELANSRSAHISSVFPSLILPSSTTSHYHAMIELKSGVGGQEASLFVGDLMKMYTGCAGARGWSAEAVSVHDLDSGGIKDAIMEVKGQGAFDALRFENGVHRVQRVPATDASGRTHTSTVAVVVLPTSDEEKNSSSGEEELFSMSDVKLEVMRARGAGGQHVNKTESAVRLTHIPTGVTVSMQDERSQHQNRRKAFMILRARLLDIKMAKEQAERRIMRRSLVRSMDRNEKIRTYNYSQDRVTDHRVGLSKNNLPLVMTGEGLNDFLDALKADHERELLEDIIEKSKEE